MAFFQRIFARRPPAEPQAADVIARRLGVPAPDQTRAVELYAFDTCPYCRRVYSAISRLDLNIPVRNVHQDPAASAKLREVTGGTQVPCLLIDGVPLLESLDIIDWLESYKVEGAAA
ncbi:MAG: hypothetical protein GXP62_09525 [Oligoflexia bacterium]|nr:hypothetical protein [Oligoflexia bacterium]